jgi:hypothetical protein
LLLPPEESVAPPQAKSAPLLDMQSTRFLMALFRMRFSMAVSTVLNKAVCPALFFLERSQPDAARLLHELGKRLNSS